jgi:hypothetical protein
MIGTCFHGTGVLQVSPLQGFKIHTRSFGCFDVSASSIKNWSFGILGWN